MIDSITIHSDIIEDDILNISPLLLTELLKDNSATRHAQKIKQIGPNEQVNIFWATDIYQIRYGENIGYDFNDPITVDKITGAYNDVVQPRVNKSKEEQIKRSREKAEVFTPSWLCNKQNNLVDNAWFNRDNVFNFEIDKADGTHDWLPTEGIILFPQKSNKTWQKYVTDIRLEITCGEAPYIASRYDTITGEFIPIYKRIGLLDRKLRIVSEHCHTKTSWINYAQKALKSVYGFDWQGDNVLIARESLLYTFIDYFMEKFNSKPEVNMLLDVARIISWNIWQMDGFKYVVPNSCHDDIIKGQPSLFEANPEETIIPCLGCINNDHKKHNGIQCLIMDWSKNKTIPFNSLIND